jgi:hypothetical protein
MSSIYYYYYQDWPRLDVHKRTTGIIEWLPTQLEIAGSLNLQVPKYLILDNFHDIEFVDICNVRVHFTYSSIKAVEKVGNQKMIKKTGLMASLV